MDEDFEVDRIAAPRRPSSTPYEPNCWLNAMYFGHDPPSGVKCRSLAGHLSNLQDLSETGYRGIEAGLIQTDDQMLLAQQCVADLLRILLQARKVHSRQDYTRMAEPILLEIQQREQEILEFLSTELEQPVAR